MERNCRIRRKNRYIDMTTNNTELQQAQELAVKWTELFYHKIHHKQNPTKEELEDVLNSLPPIDDLPWQSEMRNSLKLKLNAKDDDDTFVHTMTREQLFLLNNPLWTKNLSTSDVQYVLNWSKQFKEYGENIEDKLAKLFSEL